MPIQVFGPDATVVSVNLALNGFALGSAAFQAAVGQVRVGGEANYANTLVASSALAGLSDAAFSGLLLGNLGLLPDAALQAALSDYLVAVGASNRGAVALQLADLLSGLELASEDLAIYANAAAAWNLKVSAGYTYSANPQNTLPSGTLGTNPGNTFTLSLNEDRLTGTPGDDIFVADAVVDKTSGKPFNSLQGIDLIDGGDGQDALNLTLAQAGTVSPVVRGIESFTVRYTADATVLSLQHILGVQKITLSASDASKASQLADIGALAQFGLTNQNTGVGLSGASGSAIAQQWTFENVGAADKQAVIDLGVNAASAARTLNIGLHSAQVNFDSTVADAATALILATSGKNTLTLTDSATSVTQVKLTGNGALDMGATSLGGVTSWDASGFSGSAAARMGNTQANVARIVLGGSGSDIYRIDGAATGSQAQLGAGDDTLQGFSEFSAYTKGLDGGSGVDVLNVVGAVGLDAAAASRVQGFEALDFGGWASSASIDLSMGSLAAMALQVDQAVTQATSSGTVSLVGAPDALSFTARSKAGVAAFAGIVSVNVQGKDSAGTTAAGTAESVNLNAELRDGDADNVADGNITLGSWSVPGYETISIRASLSLADGGLAALKGASHFLTLNGLSGQQLETVNLSGDVNIRLPNSINVPSLTRVDATASSGGVVFNAGTATSSVSFVGGTGADQYTAGLGGDIVQAGLGVDVVALGVIMGKAGAKRDTIVLKSAADSRLTDSNADGAVTVSADVGFDVVQQFDRAGDPAAASSTTDRIDVSAFALTGTARGLFNASTIVTGASNLTLVNDAFGGRGTAFSVIGADTYFMLDVNGDGHFSASADLLLKLVGLAAGLTEASVVF